MTIRLNDCCLARNCTTMTFWLAYCWLYKHVLRLVTTLQGPSLSPNSFLVRHIKGWWDFKYIDKPNCNYFNIITNNNRTSFCYQLADDLNLNLGNSTFWDYDQLKFWNVKNIVPENKILILYFIWTSKIEQYSISKHQMLYLYANHNWYKFQLMNTYRLYNAPQFI